MADDLKKLLKEFLAEAKLEGRTIQGLIGLRKSIPHLFAYLEEKNLQLMELKLKEAVGYQGWLRERLTKKGNKYSGRTIDAYLVSATAFCEFVKSKGVLAVNPFKEMRKIRPEKKLPQNILREKELCRLLERLAHYRDGANLKQQKTRYKVHVIAELMYATGMRISEVAALRVDDIDFANSIVNVREGKGGQSRICLLNTYACEVLRLYVEKMQSVLFSEWNGRNSNLLFGVRWGQFGHVVNDTLKQAAVEAGTGRFNTHGFRHALGSHLLRAGCSIRHIQAILGHKALRNTEVYTKVEREDLKEVLDKFHPRQFKRVRDE
jgi:site-specific recombinase XerD